MSFLKLFVYIFNRSFKGLCWFVNAKIHHQKLTPSKNIFFVLQKRHFSTFFLKFLRLEFPLLLQRLLLICVRKGEVAQSEICTCKNNTFLPKSLCFDFLARFQEILLICEAKTHHQKFTTSTSWFCGSTKNDSSTFFLGAYFQKIVKCM